MGQMLIFGLGYAAGHFADRLHARGWDVTGTTQDGRAGSIAFGDESAVLAALRSATHIVSSVPPVAGADPVLTRYGDAIAVAPATWTGYLSSTGVYGDAGGAWVDESAPIKGRRADRNAADAAWQALRSDVRVFRLPGIYGPGRSILDRIGAGRAHRIALPDQVFSRIHVDDIAGGVIASFRGPPGVYNLADDEPCHQNRLVEWGAAMLGAPLPPLQTLDEAGLSPAAHAFYAENRRVANGRAKRLLGWAPRYPSFREGLSSCL
ncbi:MULTISPECIES: SDR family NAD(P)-dependent oxidoreductase [unclassified Sphingopyxis]|uniref:SDR family NAD(P)-dependent oxidoreductase n=1 Tax=unclassified Sphingopyxis TaxID=2614943 RepID=UPI002862322F|nr:MULTISPECIES: SDR family NAD(P)-dependent oxidoreductase [unclassified Sphingopyxis]MDR6834521.1 nucleoside-diphosphate-sugar epimerase [Sphingopyxis sp. BE122]MDR7226791.1 nucleoside-diphosphate-sugar epimerase [Sphingopyxis sp. BE259]